MNYYRVFFTCYGERWWHDIWANDAESVLRSAEAVGYLDVVVQVHEGAKK